MKKQFGIWLDFREANIISLVKKEVNITNIQSEIEDYNPKGGARSKSPWGPQDKISESKFLARRKQQEKAYFEKLISAVKGADELFVFGPAEAKNGLLKLIKKDQWLNGRLLGFENADSMSGNKQIARVKAFFSN